MRNADAPDPAPASWRREILAGLRQGGLFAAGALLVLYLLYLVFGGAPHRAPQQPVAATASPTALPSQPAPLKRELDFGAVRAPADVTRVAAWAVREADNGDRPFVIVDKRRAQVYVFEPSGRLAGTSPVLLGFAAGDRSVAGIGSKAIAEIQPHERTTPAGRFESKVGRNADGEEVVWVDYDAAVSMHRVRATNPQERRLERLATPTAADNRISWGCINVPVAFFEEQVWPQIGRNRGIVYVLPEREPLTAFFPAAADTQHLAQAAAARSNSAKP